MEIVVLVEGVEMWITIKMGIKEQRLALKNLFLVLRNKILKFSRLWINCGEKSFL
jgi:hypothetical protein